MNRAEALRSIRYDLLEPIQKRVRVDFDNTRQMPACFAFQGKKYVVEEVLDRFKTQVNRHVNAYLVNVVGGATYFLYFMFCDEDQPSPFYEGFWVLSFRILDDRELMAFYREERKMLVNMTMKKAVDFHGHLCPELVIGGKVCEYAKRLISQSGGSYGSISILAENCTSALDAIQVLLGATIGNQRLKVVDFGKHNYTVSLSRRQVGIRLSLKSLTYEDEEEYARLEEKILSNPIRLDDVVQLQELLDARSERLLSLSPEDLFEVEHIDPIQGPTETAGVYRTCCKCGQQVLQSRIVHFRDELYCIPCMQKMNTSCGQFSLQ